MITHCEPRNASGGASGNPNAIVRTSTSVSTAGKSSKLRRIHVAGSSYSVSRNSVYWYKKNIMRVADKKREIKLQKSIFAKYTRVLLLCEAAITTTNFLHSFHETRTFK
jgi:hypothetical protein